MKWYVRVKLEAEYDDIEAEDEDEAFEIASEYAMAGGDWDYIVASADDEEEKQNVELNSGVLGNFANTAEVVSLDAELIVRGERE